MSINTDYIKTNMDIKKFQYLINNRSFAYEDNSLYSYGENVEVGFYGDVTDVTEIDENGDNKNAQKNEKSLDQENVFDIDNFTDGTFDDEIDMDSYYESDYSMSYNG